MKKITLFALLFTLSVQAQTIDPTFNPNHAGPYTEYIGNHGVIRSDGKILTRYAGNGVNYVKLYNNDGSIDTAFNQVVLDVDRRVYVSPNGKFVCLYGDNSSFNTYEKVKAFNADGMPVSGFISPTFTQDSSTGSFDLFYSAIVQDDGKIILGGNFITVNGLSRKNIVRLNADGSVDTSFTVGTGFNDNVYAMAPQLDGKYVVGGKFSTYSGSNRRNLVRLNSDGTIDSSFYNFYAPSGYAFDTYPNRIEVQPDGSIMVCGPHCLLNGIYKSRGFTRLLSTGAFDTTFSFLTDPADYGDDFVPLTSGKYLLNKAGHLYRLNTNGSIDTSFLYSNAVSSTIVLYTGDLQAFSDGKALINTGYASSTGLKRVAMFRINVDGSTDLTFNPQQSTVAYCPTMKALKDNKVILAGTAGFSSYNETPCRNVMRITENGELDPTFILDSRISNGGSLNIKQQDDNKLLFAKGPSYAGTEAINVTNSSSVVESKSLIRIQENGTLDLSFNCTLTSVRDYEILSSGKILVSSLTASSAPCIMRLNSDGSVDTSFTTLNTSGSMTFTKFNDGSLFMIGNFNSGSSSSISKLYKLSADGTIDTSFSCPYIRVSNIFRQSADNYLVSYVDVTNSKISRINGNGIQDATFSTITKPTVGAAYTNTCKNVFVNSQGKIFTYFIYDGTTYMDIHSPDGVLEQAGTNPYNSFTAIQQSCDRILVSSPGFLTNDISLQDIKRYYIFTGTFVPAPLGNTQQTFTINSTIADLIAAGESILWYPSQTQCGQNLTLKAAEVNDTPLPSSTPLVDGTTYYASQTIGGIESTYRLPVTVHAALGVNNFSNDFIHIVNPVSDILTLTSTKPINKVYIYSLNGVKVFEKEINQVNDLQISTSKLSTAVYILKVYTNDGVYSKKLIKN